MDVVDLKMLNFSKSSMSRHLFFIGVDTDKSDRVSRTKRLTLTLWFVADPHLTLTLPLQHKHCLSGVPEVVSER